MKKIGCFVWILMMAALLLTGCATNADGAASPTPVPNTTKAAPGTSPSPTANVPILSDIEKGAESLMGLTTLESVQEASESMEDAVEQLSEVDDAYVIAHKHQALVGLKMNSQYQGDVDERLQKMVLTRVKTIEKGITDVFVTDDAEKVEEIKKLSEKLDGTDRLEDLLPAFEELSQGIPAYQE